MRNLLVAIPLAVSAVSAFAQDKAPEGSADRGLEAYMKFQCYTCHGTVGQGGERNAGPRLTPNPFPWAAFAVQVRTPRQDMPAYRKAHLSDEELANIYAYIASITPSPGAKEIPLLNF